eukprot:g4092.t1
MSAISSSFKLALCQIRCCTADKALNLATARKAVDKAVKDGAEFVALPECFNSPYDTTQFRNYAEPIPSSADPSQIKKLDDNSHPTTKMLSDAARENNVWLLGGSYPEVDSDNGNVYNTSVVFGPDGQLVTKHRKVHLFDIDIPGGQYFKESDSLSPGNCFTTFDTPWCKMGLAICYDLRFPDLARRMKDEGCEVLLYPAAFNVTTGPLHWELLLRARAVDNQLYVAAISPARNETGEGYQAYGYSMLVDPWGKILGGGEAVAEKTGTVIEDVNLETVDAIRKSIPISFQQRPDVYSA